jgi:hypothetical protein
MGESVTGLFGKGATFDTVELEIDPPDTWNSHQTPKSNLPEKYGEREPVEEEEVAKDVGEEEWEAKDKEDSMGDG